MTDIIRAEHLSKLYKVSEDIETIALKDVSFSIKRGEYVAVMGPSGSGKSTLMHILGALDVPSSGKYFLNGKEVGILTDDELADIRNKQIGFVFQAYNLLPRATALRNVMIPMMYGGVEKEKREARAKDLLELVGLGDRMHHHSNQLSGGQQQRVAIARALTMNPAIILADEPTGNISGEHVKEIMDTFEKLNKNGHTLILITHEPEIASRTKRILFLRDGKLIDDKKK